MVLTRIVLGTRYSIRQFFGASLCIGGLASVFLSVAGVGGGGHIFFSPFFFLLLIIIIVRDLFFNLLIYE